MNLTVFELRISLIRIYLFVLQTRVDAPINDIAEQVCISSLALLKVKKFTTVSCFHVMNIWVLHICKIIV